MESARCREAELQAWTAFSASQLRHGTNSGAAGFTVPVAASDEPSSNSNNNPQQLGGTMMAMMPGSCVDAWQAVARAAAQKDEDQEGEGAEPMQLDLLSHSTATATTAIEIPPGQQSAAVQTLCTANSLEKMAELAATVQTERGDCAKRWKQTWQPLLTDSNNTSQQSWWLQALDERLQEIRKYHAEHSSAASSSTTAAAATMNSIHTALASLTTTTSSTTTNIAKKHDRQHGNPVADGYDLAATVEQWTHQMDAALYSVDEVRGKYLDLQSLHQQLLQIGIGNNRSNSQQQQQSFVSQLRSSNSSNDDGQHESKSNIATTKKNQQQYQYIDFLEDLAKGFGRAWPNEAAKLSQRRKYRRWLRSLREYLQQFLRKTVPLLPVQEQIVAAAEREFCREWSQSGGAVAAGWRAVPAEAALAESILGAGSATDDGANTNDDNDTSGVDKEKQTTTTTTAKIDLAKYASAEELAAQVDGDRLKAELSLLGLKCGGTVLDRAQRLFLLKDCPLHDLPPKVFAKNSKLKKQQQQQSSKNQDATMSESNTTTAAATAATASTEALLDRRIDLARAECVVAALLDQVRPKLEATIRRTERRQTQTLKEREREMADELFGAGVVVKKKKPKTEQDGDGDGNDNSDSDSDEDDAPIYNPKNVPLDWDGKPIPYWLFKLHGLNHYYGCEICGGESYRGRRNFELHFAEQRHGAGMRALGIPNTKHFHGVTKIEDARDLWRSLQDRLAQEQFDGMREEEYEDSSGNVLSRKTYEDLARQGLL